MTSEENVRAWLALREIPGAGDLLCRRLAEAFGGAPAVFAAGPAALAARGLPAGMVRAIARFRGWAAVDRELARAARLGVGLLALDDPAYPASLRFTFDPPPVLWVRGGFAPEDAQAIALVGSRAASAYGLSVAERLARDLAAAGVTVVSGLALGVDGAAHRGALDAGGRTIAVLGSGVDRLHPSRHAGLAARAAEAGAVVSELPLGTPAAPHHFPRRNRIVSGLAQGVVVVEAGPRSGSLITARLALEQGRDVFAVPGEVGLERSRGPHRLLREGARLVESAADVLEESFPWLAPAAPPERAPAPAALSPAAARVLAAFEARVELLDALVERSRLGAPRALEALLELELAGLVRQRPGGTVSREDAGG